LVREHLAQTVAVHDLDVGKVRENLENAPLRRIRAITQSCWREPRHGRSNLLRTFLRRFQMLFQFGFRHAHLPPKTRPALASGPLPSASTRRPARSIPILS